MAEANDAPVAWFGGHEITIFVNFPQRTSRRMRRIVL